MPLLIKLAKKRGNAAHAGPGENIWSNVHIDDLVTLYALAIEKAPAGAFYFAENGEDSMREACVAINRMLGIESAGRQLLFRRERREFDARSLRGDQPHAGFCGTAHGDVDGGSRRRMERGHDRGYDGLQQPRAGEARAATRLEAEGARLIEEIEQGCYRE